MLIVKGNDIESGKFVFDKPTVVTLGKFDGIHLGHLKLIETAKMYCAKLALKSVMFSFYPHPTAFFNKSKPFYAILSREERIMEAEKYGINIFLEYDFTDKFANITSDDFIKILSDKLKCKVLVVGSDYHFGKNREGDISVLQKSGKKYGFDTIKIEKVERLGEKVSSTNIRKFIAARDFENAEILLGKKYFICGSVCVGNKIGRTIGFPTANIMPYNDKLLPPDGVYITTVEFENKTYPSITNIGKNPTVNGTFKTVETFLLNFDRDIYNKFIKVNFCKFLREEIKFDSIDLLKKQLTKDKSEAKKYFK